MKTLFFAALIITLVACQKDEPGYISGPAPSINVINVVKFATKTRFDVSVNQPELIKSIHFYYGTSVDVPVKSGSFFVNQVSPLPGKFTIWAKDGRKIEMGGTW
jgi:hypothetical protein